MRSRHRVIRILRQLSNATCILHSKLGLFDSHNSSKFNLWKVSGILGEIQVDTTALANQIAQKVIADTAFWVAIIGLVGAVIGSVLTLAGNFLLHWFQDRPRQILDNRRKNLLKIMLDDSRFPKRWRCLSTLSRVVGADEETTKRLLIEVGARGSEKNDGFWGLITHHPFSEIDQ